MTNAIKVLLQMQSVFLQLESTLYQKSCGIVRLYIFLTEACQAVEAGKLDVK
jgi:hypothetical protein